MVAPCEQRIEYEEHTQRDNKQDAAINLLREDGWMIATTAVRNKHGYAYGIAQTSRYTCAARGVRIGHQSIQNPYTAEIQAMAEALKDVKQDTSESNNYNGNSESHNRSSLKQPNGTIRSMRGANNLREEKVSGSERCQTALEMGHRLYTILHKGLCQDRSPQSTEKHKCCADITQLVCKVLNHSASNTVTREQRSVAPRSRKEHPGT